jgi:hypothetical protein
MAADEQQYLRLFPDSLDLGSDAQPPWFAPDADGYPLTEFPITAAIPTECPVTAASSAAALATAEIPAEVPAAAAFVAAVTARAETTIVLDDSQSPTTPTPAIPTTSAEPLAEGCGSASALTPTEIETPQSQVSAATDPEEDLYAPCPPRRDTLPVHISHRGGNAAHRRWHTPCPVI